MKAMKIVREFIALTAILIGMIGWAGDSVPFLLDTIEPLVETGEEVSFSYNSSWVGGDSSAEIVISADRTEIKRTTGEGEFVWSPTTAGKHTLAYTTYINGVAQDDVYTATVYADWKYTIEDGKATIVETTQTSGDVTIPSEIDGYPVVGLGAGLFNGCASLKNVIIPKGVTYVGGGVFRDCSGLTNLVLESHALAMGKSGLKQAKFDASFDTSSMLEDSVEVADVSGVIAAYQKVESSPWQFSDPATGETYAWDEQN